jgi:hypothetical protein
MNTQLNTTKFKEQKIKSKIETVEVRNKLNQLLPPAKQEIAKSKNFPMYDGMLNFSFYFHLEF